MNLWSSAIGGRPMCHGAGGMAGHVKFGAHTGGASIMLGVILLTTGLFLGDSVALLFKLFPPAVLGVILFLAGAQLALGGKDAGHDKTDRLVVLTTAAFAIWNVGIAVLFGIFVYHASKRGWVKL
jgi:MFS superfamily sulfate permease-like transporter